MKGSALFLYGENYDYLSDLSSPKISVYSLVDILNGSGSDYGPDWILIEDPKLIKGGDSIIRIINNFKRSFYLNKSDIAFLYIAGHGYTGLGRDIFVCTQMTDFNDVGAGVSVVKILNILCEKKVKNIVLCLDLCREYQSNYNINYCFIDEIKKISHNFSSISIIVSTVEGSVSYGGKKNEASPFALGLRKMLSDEYVATPILYFENILNKLLENNYNESGLVYSEPEFIPIPKNNDRNIFGFYVSSRQVDGGSVLSFYEINVLVDVIIDRERKSFKSDPFISGYKDLLPIKIYLNGNEYGLDDIIKETNNPLIVVGDTGSGKTMLAKKSSLYLATLYKTSKVNKLAIYFNAAFLNKYQNVELDNGINVLCEYFKDGRYFVDIENIVSFFDNVKIILLVDGIEDLKNKNSLKKLLLACKEKISMNYIIFCQPFDSLFVKTLLGEVIVDMALIKPIKRIEVDGQYSDVFDRVDNEYISEMSPLELQLLKKYIYRNAIQKIVYKDMACFEYDNIKQRIERIVDQQYGYNLDEQLRFKDVFVRLFSVFALYIRRAGYFIFFEYEVGKKVYNKLVEERGYMYVSYDKFVEVGIRANILQKKDSTVKFVSRSLFDVLIVKEWLYLEIDSSYLAEMSRSSLWYSSIVIYSMVISKKRFPFNKILSVNPFVAVSCVSKGYVLSENQLSVLINGILKESSHWTRNEASKMLYKLPYKISGRLMQIYKKIKSYDKKTSIAIALGMWGDNNIDFLLKEYKDLLSNDNSKASYLRRRILDILLDKYKIDRVSEWLTIKPYMKVNELARVIRSVKVENIAEIRILDDFINNKYNNNELLLIKTLMLYKKQKLLISFSMPIIDNDVLLKKNLVQLLSLKEKERMYKCLPALIIDELSMVEMCPFLYDSLKYVKDSYAIAEIIYVLFAMGSEDIIKGLSGYLEYYLKSDEFVACNAKVKKGLYNDIKQGLMRAAYSGKINHSYNMKILPEYIRRDVYDFMSVVA